MAKYRFLHINEGTHAMLDLSILEDSARKWIKPGHINNPLNSAVWAELNNCSGMQSIIIDFYSIIDFHFKFCQVNIGVSN